MKTPRKNLSCHASTRRGSALILSIVSVVLVSAMAAGFMNLALSVTRRLSSSLDTARALNIAEAGLCEAYTGLATARTGNVGTEELPVWFGGGLFWVEATEHDNGLVELESTAMYGTGRATLGVACEPVSASVSSLGVFALNDVVLASDGLLDSYDSTLGGYRKQIGTPAGERAVLGSNESVSVESGASVLGDILHGPTGGAQIDAEAGLSGASSGRPELAELPPIELPEVDLAPMDVRLNGTPIVIPPGKSGFEEIDVPASGSLLLQGPLTLVIGSLVLQRGAEISFDTSDGPIDLHIIDELDFRSGSRVHTSKGAPSDLVLLVASDEESTANLAARGAFHGFVYAPKAAVQVTAAFEVFGGIVCRDLRVGRGCRLHLDLSLMASLESMLPLVHSWRIVELPKMGATLRLDPFKLLGLDPSTLPTPSEAHADQVLGLKYLTVDGITAQYSGMESSFDWDLVGTLLFGERDGEPFYLPAEELIPPQPVDPMLDLVSSSMSSKDLRDALRAAAPVSDEVLIAACQRTPPMDKSDLNWVLGDHNPLSDVTLLAAIDSRALDSSTLKGLLINNSPVSAPALNAALSRTPPLSPSDLSSLLASQ